MSHRKTSLVNVSQFFVHRNVFGWFLSNSGPDAEETMSKMLEVIDNWEQSNLGNSWFFKWQFSLVAVHKLGTELLAPMHERLHFNGDGLTNYNSAGLFNLSPEQRKRWTNAFTTLAAYLRCVKTVHSSVLIS